MKRTRELLLLAGFLQCTVALWGYDWRIGNVFCGAVIAGASAWAMWRDFG